MPYSLAIFDLDGTLADSFPWFLRTINGVADRFGFRRVADEDVERLRHASSREILNRLEVPLWKLPAIARHARRLKGEAAAEIALFAGVEAMLKTLAGNGVQLALVTSDSEANAREKLGDCAALFAHFDCAASLFGKVFDSCAPSYLASLPCRPCAVAPHSADHPGIGRRLAAAR